MMHTRPILGFVGSSGSGKTTLLESIVSLLSDKGVRLAVVKHAKPGFDLDQNPRKDSHRLRPSQGQPPQCWVDDPDVIAVASDGYVSTGNVPLLDLKDHLSIACFAARHLGLPEPDSEYIVDRSAAGQQP